MKSYVSGDSTYNSQGYPSRATVIFLSLQHIIVKWWSPLPLCVFTLALVFVIIHHESKIIMATSIMMASTFPSTGPKLQPEVKDDRITTEGNRKP
jgi:hypothetical protein